MVGVIEVIYVNRLIFMVKLISFLIGEVGFGFFFCVLVGCILVFCWGCVDIWIGGVG